MKPRARLSTGKAVLWSTIAAVMIATSAILHVGTPLARQVASAWLAQWLSAQMKGELSIGAIDALSPWNVEARDLVLRDGSGAVVIVARRLTLSPDVSALLGGSPRFRSARLEGATATLIDDGTGLPTLLSSFDSAIESDTEDESPATPVVIDGIQIEGLRLRGELLGLRDIDAVDVSARGSLEIADEVHVRIDAASGQLVSPFPFPAHIERLTGTISTVPAEGIDLRAAATRDQERATARIRYRTPASEDEGRLTIELQAEEVTPETLEGLGYDWAAPIAVPVTGELQLDGPTDDLSLRARVDTRAGSAQASGTISSDQGVRVRIESDELALQDAFDDGPRVTAGGSVELHARGDEPLRIRADVKPLVYDKIAVPSFQLEGRFEDGTFHLDRAHSPHGALDASGVVRGDGSIELAVRARIPDIGRDPNLKRLVKNARGRLDADVRVVTRTGGKGLRFRGRLVLTNVRYGLVSAKRLVLQGSAQGDPERPALDLSVDGREVALGVYALGDARLEVDGGPRRYLTRGHFLRGGRRTFDVDARVESTPEGLRIDADKLELAVGEDTWRGKLEGLEVLRQDVVKLALLKLANRSQRLEAHGIVRTDGDDNIEAQLQDFDLAAVHALVGDAFYFKEGRTDTRLSLTGDLARPQVLLQGALREGVALDVRDVNALYFASYDTGQLELDAEADLGERGLLRASGSGFVDPSMNDPVQALLLGSYQMELSAEKLDLALWPAVRDTEVKGRVGGSIRLHGTLASPELAGNVELTPLTYPGWDPLLVAGKLQYEGQRMRLGLSVADERGTFVLADAQMSLDWGELMKDPQTTLETALRSGWSATGQTLPRRLDQWPRPVSSAVPLPIRLETGFSLGRHAGETRGEVRFDARWEQPLGTEICASDVKAGMRGEAVLAGGETSLSGELIANSQKLASVSVEVDTPVDEWIEDGYHDPRYVRASSRISIEDVGEVPWLCEYGEGSLLGELELDRARGSSPLFALTLDSSIVPRRRRIGIKQGTKNIRGCEESPLELSLDVNADDHRMLATGTLDGCSGGPARLRARIPVEWEIEQLTPTPTNTRISQIYLDLDASQIGPFLPQIPGVLSGEAIARGKLGLVGPIDALKSEGRIDIDDARLYLVATGQELTEVSGALEFRGDWAKLERLEARDDDGRVELKGGIGFDNVTPTRLRLATNMRDFPVRSEGMAMAWLTGGAAIDADVGEDRTRTAIRIHSLDIQLPDKINRSLQPLDPHPDVVVTTQEDPLVEPGYVLEFHVQGDDDIEVRRNDVEADLALELAVVYSDPDLLLGGYVEFRRGRFEVQGKSFRINRGSLRFDGSADFDPDVNLVATHDVAGGSPVVVTITGTVSDPDITFASDACPGEGEALAYLLWGRCLADDPGAAEESAQAEDALAADMVGALLGGAIGMLGIEREYGGIRPTLAIEQGGGNEARVKAGVLTDSLIPKFMRGLVQRIYVQGAVTTGSSEEDFEQTGADAGNTSSLDFLIELYFPHNIVGSGRFAPESWGVDLIWEP